MWTANISSTPTIEQREESSLNLTVAGTSEAVLMVEAGAKEVSEEVMLGGILFAHEEIKKIVAFLNGIVAEIGKPKKEFPLVLPGEDVKAAVREYALRQGAVDVRNLRPLRAQRPRGAGQGRGRRALCRAVRRPRDRGRRRAVRHAEGSHAPPHHRRGRASRRPQAHRSAPHLVRSRRAAPCSWLRRVHPRPDSGHDRSHPGARV